MSEAWIVSTDMDGTLLAHDGYDYAAALPAIRQLEQRNIPLVLNSSKTFAELETWIQRLNIVHPFVVENGSAIYSPKGYFTASEHSDADERFDIEVIGQPIADLRAFVDDVRPNAVDFTTCSLPAAMQMTGLDEASAIQARTRRYSIPLRFDDPDERNAFCRQADASGFGVLQGGRFTHLMGRTDKGMALQWLRQTYQRKTDTDHIRALALGDSQNDAAMLECADMAVIVASPSSSQLKIHNQHQFRTVQSAPAGWAEGIGQWIDTLSPQQTGGNLKHG